MNARVTAGISALLGWRARRVKELDGTEISLIDVPLDREVRVTRIDTTDTRRVNRLASLGILPGATLRLIQNRGAFVAVVERDQVAFDSAVARSVWVRGDGD